MDSKAFENQINTYTLKAIYCDALKLFYNIFWNKMHKMCWGIQIFCIFPNFTNSANIT